jgi:hypothetical protein
MASSAADAYGSTTEIYAYRPDYLGQAVGVIDGYTGEMRASCALVPSFLPKRRKRRKDRTCVPYHVKVGVHEQIQPLRYS